MSHVNIPVFVPHLGCPHTCVFCNQRTITGVSDITLDEFDKTVTSVLATLDHTPKKQIAFFGGSFTAIERNLMIALLEKAQSYIKRGDVASIRLSTRPDAIDDEILAILASHGVTDIELGIQSTDPAVLAASERGHTEKDSENACKLIKQHGFTLVGQMMLGLPTSTWESECQTARDMIAWGVDACRIYPTVVFADTALHRMMKENRYTPLTTDEAVQRGAAVYEILDEHHIEVIRMGLCETDSLRSEKTVGGAYHPAFGELVMNRFYLRKILSACEKITLPQNAALIIETAPRALSQAIGQKKCNLYELEKKYPENKILFRPSPDLWGKEVKILVKEN